MSEYLMFNIFIFAGPLFFGMMKRHYFVDKWFPVVSSIFIVGIPFIIWDSLVTNTHWMFNEKYILGITIANLPVEELLFFITVPFACLYTWEMIQMQLTLKTYSFDRVVYAALFIFLVAGVVLFLNGLEYTGLVFLFLSVGIIIDLLMGTRLIMQNRFYLFVIFIVLFTLIFNGYLTWRPVVIYGETYQLGFRIFTIPVEDFLYGISLIHLNAIIYEKIKQLNLSRFRFVTS